MSYAYLAWHLRHLHLKIAAPKKTRFSAPLEIFQVAHRYAYGCVTKECRQQTEVIQNHEVKPDIENIRGLNLAVVKLKTVQVTRLPR
jgi:hypothetical protein